MSDLPKNWAVDTIENLTSYVSRGKSPKYTPLSALPVINQKCVRWTGVDERYVKYVDPASWESWSDERYLQHGDILWNSTGTGTIGRAAIYRGLPSYSRAVVDSHVTIVRTNDGIDSTYVYRFIQSPEVQHRIEAMQTGSTNQVELNRSEVVSIEVPVPPLAEQRRIVEKLDALTARTARARADLDRIPALAARYKQAVLAKAFSGELTADWRASSAQTSASEDEQNALRLEAWSAMPKRRGKYAKAQSPDWTPANLSIPEAWRWASVDELAYVIQYGTSAKTSDTPAVPVLRMGNIVDGKLDYEKLKFLPERHDEFPELLLDDGDLLFNRTNSPELVGKTAVYRDIGKPVSFASYLIRLKTVNCVPELLSAYINSSYGRHWVSTATSQQVGQANVNGTKLRGLGVPLMPLEEQQLAWTRIQSAFADIDRMVTEAAAARRLLDRLDQAVLAKAFRGELVPQDPSDEPASALLDRIHAERAAAPKAKRGRRKTAA